MSIELPVATRHRRDMTEKLLKATLNPNKQHNNTSDVLIILVILVIQTRTHVLSSSVLRDREIVGLNPYHLTERDTRRLTCSASDVQDRERNRGQDNVTNINTGSGVRRIIFKRQQCMYKSEQRYINENLFIRNARARTHTAFLSLFSIDYN